MCFKDMCVWKYVLTEYVLRKQLNNPANFLKMVEVFTKKEKSEIIDVLNSNVKEPFKESYVKQLCFKEICFKKIYLKETCFKKFVLRKHVLRILTNIVNFL